MWWEQTDSAQKQTRCEQRYICCLAVVYIVAAARYWRGSHRKSIRGEMSHKRFTCCYCILQPNAASVVQRLLKGCPLASVTLWSCICEQVVLPLSISGLASVTKWSSHLTGPVLSEGRLLTAQQCMSSLFNNFDIAEVAELTGQYVFCSHQGFCVLRQPGLSSGDHTPRSSPILSQFLVGIGVSWSMSDPNGMEAHAPHLFPLKYENSFHACSRATTLELISTTH